uniref:Olfactory receptor family 5 subfamily H member 8/pseudo n=1 Tax=Macaca nemestrina TaxID=9545 RepID=A0A2K6DVL0_MACNE
MDEENATLLTKFLLTGLTYQSEWKIPLFLAFLIIYLITIMGNLGLIAVIWKDSHLHIPMYLFLGNLAFADAWLSSAVTPRMLISFFTKKCFLLATMAYDRYVAICKPLLYPVIMTNGLCIRLLVLSFVGGFLHALIHEGISFRLTFCNSNIIHHFYCDIPLLTISCTDPSINFLMLFILSGSIQVFTILTILVSYAFVLFTVLKKKSVKGIRKAFSTCGAHLLSVCLYYGPLLFMYVGPAPPQADDQDMVESLFYIVIIPFLNPMIYSLRNKQVIDSLTKTLKGSV